MAYIVNFAFSRVAHNWRWMLGVAPLLASGTLQPRFTERSPDDGRR